MTWLFCLTMYRGTAMAGIGDIACMAAVSGGREREDAGH